MVAPYDSLLLISESGAHQVGIVSRPVIRLPFSRCDTLTLERPSFKIGLDHTITPDDDAMSGCTGGNIVPHADHVTGQPEPITVDAEVHPFGSQVWINRALHHLT